MTLELAILGLGMALSPVIWAIASYAVTRIQDLRGARNSLPPSGAATWLPRKPSIERSATNSMALITVPANPDRPLAYSVEPLNGSSRLVVLTAVYEQSLDASESAILKSNDFASSPPPTEPPIEGVDDPRWMGMVEAKREASAWKKTYSG